MAISAWSRKILYCEEDWIGADPTSSDGIRLLSDSPPTVAAELVPLIGAEILGLSRWSWAWTAASSAGTTALGEIVRSYPCELQADLQ